MKWIGKQCPTGLENQLRLDWRARISPRG
jgi:hypothetical protein